MSGERYLSQGATGAVFLEDSREVVRKVYRTGNFHTDLLCARREFDYQQRYWERLKSTTGVSCPQPLELIEEQPVTVRMEACPGIPLYDYLLIEQASKEELEVVADSVAKGLLIYVETFNEPHYDFHFSNVLYDVPSGRVTLIDFGKGLRIHEVDPAIFRLPPLEVSLGWALGTIIYEHSRPGLALKGMRSDAVLAFFTQVYGKLENAGLHKLSSDVVVKASWAKYKNMAHIGKWSRKAWYRTVGNYLAAKQIKSLLRGLKT